MSDLQVLRRSRVAYGPGPLFHYLHYDEHHYHVGDVNPSNRTERGVRVPVVTGPRKPGSFDWQTDGHTRQVEATLFDLVYKHLR
jgi:hypothetical protein